MIRQQQQQQEQGPGDARLQASPPGMAHARPASGQRAHHATPVMAFTRTYQDSNSGSRSERKHGDPMMFDEKVLKVAQAPECCKHPHTLVLTDKRLIFKWTYGASSCLPPSFVMEESFSYSDVVNASVSWGASIFLMWLGLGLILGGIVSLVEKELQYGIPLLVAGVVLVCRWLIRIFRREYTLRIDFSRKGCNIHSWAPLGFLAFLQNWARVPATHRELRLSERDAGDCLDNNNNNKAMILSS